MIFFVAVFNSLYSDDLPSSNKLRVSMVSWSPDDQFVITAVTDSSIKVWNSHSGALVHTLRVGLLSALIDR